tara:strand:- start:19 stop:348 length:330 start_codon:yes stop_codon:yes gene_type:complete
MACYYNKIQSIYPIAIEGEDYKLREIDGVTTLNDWNTDKLGAKPTLASLDAQINDNDAELDGLNKANNRHFTKIKAIGLTMKEFMNEIMAGRTTPISNSEFKTKFKSHL